MHRYEYYYHLIKYNTCNVRTGITIYKYDKIVWFKNSFKCIEIRNKAYIYV